MKAEYVLHAALSIHHLQHYNTHRLLDKKIVSDILTWIFAGISLTQTFLPLWAAVWSVTLTWAKVRRVEGKKSAGRRRGGKGESNEKHLQMIDRCSRWLYACFSWIRVWRRIVATFCHCESDIFFTNWSVAVKMIVDSENFKRNVAASISRTTGPRNLLARGNW